MDKDTQRLIDLGREMRLVQVECSENGSEYSLVRAKQLEVRFDSLLHAIQDDDETGLLQFGG